MCMYAYAVLLLMRVRKTINLIIGPVYDYEFGKTEQNCVLSQNNKDETRKLIVTIADVWCLFVW